MDLTFGKEELAFQQEVRDWLKENLTPEILGEIKVGRNAYMPKERLVEMIAGGITPSEVADQVVAAIRAEQFLVLTHDHHRADVLAAELDSVLGTAWDDALEAYRDGGEGAEVSWLSRGVG